MLHYLLASLYQSHPQGDDTPSSSLTIGSLYKWNANRTSDGLMDTGIYGFPTAYVADANIADYLRGVAYKQSAAVSTSLVVVQLVLE